MKFNEIQVKELLEDTNDFQPSFSFFNQEGDTLLFGSIKLDGYWLNTNSFINNLAAFKSQILKGERKSRLNENKFEYFCIYFILFRFKIH